MSKFEDKVANLLTQNHIKFKREVIFPDLKNYGGHNLRFDFVCYKQNKIAFIIEVDGIQHYKYVARFYKTQLDFQKAQERDRRKNSYCLSHNIPLIRIPYWEEDNLSLQTLLNPNYRVKTRFHLDYQRR